MTRAFRLPLAGWLLALALFAPETPKSVFSLRMAMLFGLPSSMAMSSRIEA